MKKTRISENEYYICDICGNDGYRQTQVGKDLCEVHSALWEATKVILEGVANDYKAQMEDWQKKNKLEKKIFDEMIVMFKKYQQELNINIKEEK